MHERQHQPRCPLRVVGLDGDEQNVEGAFELVELIGVYGVDLDAMLARAAVEQQAVVLHGLHVLTPRVDQRDVLACFRHEPGERAAYGTHADCADSSQSHALLDLPYGRPVAWKIIAS